MTPLWKKAFRVATLRKVGAALGLLLFWGYGWHALVTDGNLGGLLGSVKGLLPGQLQGLLP